MKAKKTLAIILAALLMVATISGCAGMDTPTGTGGQPSSQQGAAQPGGSGSGAAPSGDPESATYIFTDSVGREVELPRNVERIAPSGSLAQIVLFSLAPDKLVGFGSHLNDEQFDYIDKKYADLPVFGNFAHETLNLESLMVAAPQVIIDVGMFSHGTVDNMEDIQGRTGIPTIFVNMEMHNILEAYETLGAVVGETEQAQRLMDYIYQTLSETEQKLASIPATERVKVFYAQDDGLTAIVDGIIHSDVIDFAGGINVAQVEESIRGGAAIISMEQLMLWNPDIVLFAMNSVYDSVESRAEWGGIRAVREGRFYEIPGGPYNWMGRPPSVNRIIGIKWLSNLLYPDVFPYDMIEEMREFYKLFYHCDVSDAQIRDLLSKSTLK